MSIKTKMSVWVHFAASGFCVRNDLCQLCIDDAFASVPRDAVVQSRLIKTNGN